MSDKGNDLPDWVPGTVDIDEPSIARIYDYLLGGYHNFEIDRQLADMSLQIYPDMALASQVSRAFLRRVENYLLDQGISQFIDIGSGIPTLGHVHEIALRRDPENRVVYIDIDPVAIAHSKAILRQKPHTFVFQADARDPQTIFERIRAEEALDFTKPVAVLFIALLHYIVDDDEVRQLMHEYSSRLAPGSYVAFTHGTYENAPPGVAEDLMNLSSKSRHSILYRSRDDIATLFPEMEIVEPGIVPTPLWHPEGPEDLFLDQPERSLAYAGVARLL